MASSGPRSERWSNAPAVTRCSFTGRANQSAIATFVDRATGFTLLVHLPGSHTTEVTIAALIDALNGLPLTLRRSLTWDRGTEMADHEQLSRATGLQIFFADAHSPWQRGSNENTVSLGLA